MIQTQPLIAYYGGKQRLAAKILPLIPIHSVYVEPFAGGAALLFKKGFPSADMGGGSDAYREVLNDLNHELITMYRVAKDRPSEFAIAIKNTLYSKSEHLKSELILRNPTLFNELEIAWAAYLQCNTSFAHIMLGGFGRSRVSQDLAKTWYSRLGQIDNAIARLAAVTIDCTDALTCLKNWDSPTTFFYIDPPYVSTVQGHYKGYTQADLDQLIDKLQTIQGKFILSHYKGIDVPPNWHTHEIKTTMSASRKKSGIDKCRTELLITNFSQNDSQN